MRARFDTHPWKSMLGDHARREFERQPCSQPAPVPTGSGCCAAGVHTYWLFSTCTRSNILALDIRSNKAGAAGVAALGEALRAGTCPQLRALDIRGHYPATKADLGELSAACPHLTIDNAI